MPANETRPAPTGAEITAGPENPNTADESLTYQYGGRNYYDSAKTKIKSRRNWYPDIDGNDVTKSYTTGF